jgi:phosphatidylglycerophosphate synthase
LSHTRINQSLSGKLEKKALTWLAQRMPAWVTPDTLTGFGLFASLVAFAGYALTRISPAYLWLASLGFILNWFGDSLDGTLARYRNIQRPRYGFFIDHTMDTISLLLIFAGIAISPYVHGLYAVLALVGYLVLSIYVYLSTYTSGIFRITYLNVGPTELRLLAVLANALVFFAGPVTELQLSMGGLTLALTIYDIVALGFAVLAVVTFIVSSTVTATALARADDPFRQRSKRKQRRGAKAKARGGKAMGANSVWGEKGI